MQSTTNNIKTKKGISLKIWKVIIITIISVSILILGFITIMNNVSNRKNENTNEVEQTNNNEGESEKRIVQFIFTPSENVRILSTTNNSVTYRGVCPNCGKESNNRKKTYNDNQYPTVLYGQEYCNGSYCHQMTYELKMLVTRIENVIK